MSNPFRILSSYNYNQIQESFNSLPDSELPIISNKGKEKQQSSGVPDWGDIDSFCNQYGFYQENPSDQLLNFRPKDQDFTRKQDQQNTPYCPNTTYSSQLQVPHDSYIVLDRVPKLTQATFFPSPLEFSGNLTNSWFNEYTNRTKSIINNDENKSESSQKLSTDQILRLAGERFVQFSSQKFININMLVHPYGSSLSGLSSGDKQDVELAQLLLAAAEKVGYKQYERASKLLFNCQWIASNAKTPVQRALSYFCEALMEKINKETGTKGGKVVGDACEKRNILAMAAMHQRLPFFQVIEFTAVQTLMESVKMKERIHLIDFQILTGTHWPAFMQAISDQKLDPIVCLKITAVEMRDKSGAERTGKLLQNFARNLQLIFSYKVVFLSDMKDLKEEHFEIEEEETVAVYFPFMLRILISKPICLKNLMTVITQRIKPSVIVVGEVEANHNSVSFVNRFIEALFYYGSLFDSLEEGMRQDEKNRLVIESGIFREGILNIVASEGYERVTRNVSINVWRAFFARFGMVELEVSTASLHQACLIVNKFACGESCTLDISSKCLLVGWKGTPFFSLSAWKLH